MRSPGQTVLMVAGVGVVAYAFYLLTSSSEPESDRDRPAKVARDEAKGERRARPVTGPSRRAARSPSGGIPVGAPADSAARPAPARDAVPEGPPRPKPDISLAEARENFAEFMAELTRLEEDGTRLESDKWVEYYKQGHDALLPLQQHLDWSVPEEAEELRKANEDMRTKLSKIEPRPAPPGE